MAGITDDELNGFLPTPKTPKHPDQLRADGIRRDIYSRHGIPDTASLAEAAAMIAERADKSGAGQSAWANPEERAAAREQYALVGKTPEERQKRWDESIYLVDPSTDQFQQGYTRDQQFLQEMATAGQTQPTPPTFWDVLKNGGATPDSRNIAREQALSQWDQSNNNPLYRDNWRSSGWDSQDHEAGGFANAVTNPDTTSGYAMKAMDVPLEFLAMQGSGESKSTGESLRNSLGSRSFSSRYRLNTPAPILDLPTTATPQERAARMKELQELARTGAIPESGERWQRTMGFTPAPIIRDMGDTVMASVDPTMLLPAVGAAKTLGKAAMVAGKGWIKPAAASVARGIAGDQMMEQATTGGILGSLGGNTPTRTWGEYFDPTPEPAALKSDAEVEAARAARDQMYALGKNNYDGVSTADAEAYKRLERANKVPSGAARYHE